LESKETLNNNSLIVTLLSIMSHLDDTNILYRSNLETLNLLKDQCNSLLKNFSLEKYRELIDFCNSKKISPGGSADLLSITIFIYFMKQSFS
jgi:holo-ACP synthase / triphosphoribosyl-dephospho-CoA synthase